MTTTRVHARRGEVAGQGLGHRVVGLEPLHQVGRAALGEEGDRQPQQMPQEAGAAQRGGDDAAAQQVRLLQPGQHGGQRHHRAPSTRTARPAARSGRRSGTCRCTYGSARAPPRRPRPAAGWRAARPAWCPWCRAAGPAWRPGRPGLRPPWRKSVAGLEDQHDAGEAGVEVLHRHEAAALAGVVDVHAAPAEAAAHAVVDDVVVELPEQDRPAPAPRRARPVSICMPLAVRP